MVKKPFLFLQAHCVVDILQNCKLNKMPEKVLNQVSVEARITFSTLLSSFCYGIPILWLINVFEKVRL